MVVLGKIYDDDISAASDPRPSELRKSHIRERFCAHRPGSTWPPDRSNSLSVERPRSRRRQHVHRRSLQRRRFRGRRDLLPLPLVDDELSGVEIFRSASGLPLRSSEYIRRSDPVRTSFGRRIAARSSRRPTRPTRRHRNVMTCRLRRRRRRMVAVVTVDDDDDRVQDGRQRVGEAVDDEHASKRARQIVDTTCRISSLITSKKCTNYK